MSTKYLTMMMMKNISLLLVILMSNLMIVVVNAHNSIENTFDILTMSVSNSIDYLFYVPKNMGDLETFLAGKKINASLDMPIITTSSDEMASEV